MYLIFVPDQDYFVLIYPSKSFYTFIYLYSSFTALKYFLLNDFSLTGNFSDN